MSSAERDSRGGWIQLATSGRAFYPLDPRPDEINVLDVAHALSNLCRFAGHTLRFYSVAEHSLHVSHRVEQLALESGESSDYARVLALAALLHDAPEAYIVDLPRPIKHTPGLVAYRAAETALERAVELRFGLSVALDHPLIKRADNDLLLTERRDLLAPNPAGPVLWAQGALGDAAPIDELDLRSGYAPGDAAAAYLARFIRLRDEGGDLQ